MRDSDDESNFGFFKDSRCGVYVINFLGYAMKALAGASEFSLGRYFRFWILDWQRFLSHLGSTFSSKIQHSKFNISSHSCVGTHAHRLRLEGVENFSRGTVVWYVGVCS